jgi:predicted nuclease of predicted toxin-antitoxin system
VRFLLDQNLSPQVAQLLIDAGHDAVHVRTLGMSRAPDNDILRVALEQDRVLVSGDTDFGDLLATSNAAKPSVLLLRRQQGRRAEQLLRLLLANLDAVADDLIEGSIVVLDEGRIRVRRLPFRLDD